jgi:NADH-ubiquinone oxidoreductase chain 5
MVMAVGLSQYNVALMHTVNHAFFKALLFLGAGAVIHSFADQQDIRRMGGLIKLLPFTYSVMLVGSLSLLATPFLTGFYSKDLILELAYGKYNFSGTYAFFLGTITAGLTAFYSFRLISLVFLNVPNGPQKSYENCHEAKLAVVIPLLILSLFSIFFGYIFSDLFVGVGSTFFGNSLFIHPNNINIIEAEFSLNILIKLLPSIFTIAGASLAIILYQSNTEILNNLISVKLGRILYTFLNQKYFFDIIYNRYIISTGLNSGYTISKVLDRGVIELLGPYGLSILFTNIGKIIAKLDTGIITTYGLYFIIGLIILVLVLFFPLLFENILIEPRLIIILLLNILILIYSSNYFSFINKK